MKPRKFVFLWLQAFARPCSYLLQQTFFHRLPCLLPLSQRSQGRMILLVVFPREKQHQHPLPTMEKYRTFCDEIRGYIFGVLYIGSIETAAGPIWFCSKTATLTGGDPICRRVAVVLAAQPPLALPKGKQRRLNAPTMHYRTFHAKCIRKTASFQ